MFKVGDRVSFEKLDWATDEEINVITTVVDVLSSQSVRLDVPRIVMDVKDLTKVPDRQSPFGRII